MVGTLGNVLYSIVESVLTSLEGDMYDRYHTGHSDSDARSTVTFPISSKGLKTGDYLIVRVKKKIIFSTFYNIPLCGKEGMGLN